MRNAASIQTSNPRQKILPELWAHQNQVVPYLVNRKEYAVFFEQGTGKTATMIHGLRHIYSLSEPPRIHRTIILAPLIVLKNWKNEFNVHSKINPNNVIVLNQDGAKRLEIFKKEIMKNPNLIVVTNYEAMQMTALVNALIAWRPEILVCDESHRLRNHQSKRAKSVLALAQHTDRRYLLTGTPILNSALDIFMPYNIMELNQKTFTNNFYQFRATYFHDANAKWAHRQNHFPDWQPRPDAHELINKLIYKKAHRVLKEECMDLPPMVKQVIEVELSPEQRRLYNDMRKEYIAYLDQESDKPKAVVAQLALTKTLRLMQICSGYVKTDEGQEINLEKIPRLAALKELLEDLTPGHKVIVWCVFKNNYRQIEKLCEELKINFRSLTGETPNKQKSIEIDEFQNDPSVRVMIANQTAGGIGINLTAASYSIFYSRNFSLEADLQAEARNYRGGSEVHKKITRIDLVAADSIDSLVVDALAKKENISEQILAWTSQL